MKTDHLTDQAVCYLAACQYEHSAKRYREEAKSTETAETHDALAARLRTIGRHLERRPRTRATVTKK